MGNALNTSVQSQNSSFFTRCYCCCGWLAYSNDQQRQMEIIKWGWVGQRGRGGRKCYEGFFSLERCRYQRCRWEAHTFGKRSHPNDSQARVISEAVESSQVRIRRGKLEEEPQRRKKSRPTLRNALKTQGHLKVTMYCRGSFAVSVNV